MFEITQKILISMDKMDLDAVKVKKKWLRSWKAMLSFQIVTGLLFLVSGSISGWRETEDALGILLSLWAMFWLFLCRKCAYENPGTKLLTFILAMSGLGLFRRLTELIKSGPNLYDLVDYGIFIAIFIWFAITSLNLIDFNKKIKKEQKDEIKAANAIEN